MANIRKNFYWITSKDSILAVLIHCIAMSPLFFGLKVLSFWLQYYKEKNGQESFQINAMFSCCLCIAPGEFCSVLHKQNCRMRGHFCALQPLKLKKKFNLFPSVSIITFVYCSCIIVFMIIIIIIIILFHYVFQLSLHQLSKHMLMSRIHSGQLSQKVHSSWNNGTSGILESHTAFHGISPCMWLAEWCGCVQRTCRA